MTRVNRIVTAAALGICLDAYGQSILAQSTSEPREDIRGREEYFWLQRSYPSTERPYLQMERARAAVSAQRQGLFSLSVPIGVAGGWRSLGPNGLFMADNGFFSSGPMLDIGRVTAVAPSPTGSLFIGTASGGVWQSTNGGYWNPLTDAQCNLTVGALSIDAADPNVLFAATGEYNANSWGCGILRSTDAGASWTQLGATSFRVTRGGLPAGSASFAKILVSRPPGGSVANTVLIGGTNVAVFRSADGGSSWNVALTGATASVIAHPTRAGVVYAGNTDNFTASRRGVYKSTDNGVTWTLLPGLPGVTPDKFERIELAVTVSAPDLLYAAIGGTDGKFLGLFIWDDAAGTWRQVAASGLYTGAPRGDFGSQSYYNLAIAVDPRDPALIYLAGVRGFRSSDGGATFSSMGMEIHADWHSIAIDPRNADIVYAGTDGGVFVSTDKGATWATRNAGLTVTQY